MHHSFDPDFQKSIIASFLEADLGEGCDCLKEEYFEDELLGDIAETIREFYQSHKEPPTKEALIHELRVKGVKAGRKFTEYLEGIEDVYERIGHNGAYYRGKAQEFVKDKVFAETLKEAYRLLESGQREEAREAVLRQARSNGSLSGAIINFFGELTKRVSGYQEEAEGKGKEKRITTGFPILNALTRGGLGAGETGVILAPAGHGKSTTLISLASAALMDKKKTLYVTLELSGKLIANKFDCNLFGDTFDVIKKKRRTFAEHIARIRESLTGDNLQIAEFPTKTLTLHRLQELVEKVQPDVLFVDYAQIMRPLKAKEAYRYELTEIHEGLRGIAGVCHIPIWTAHQANRPSLGRKEIGMENIAEDFNIAGVVDLLISLNQSEEEKQRGIIRLHLVKNRLGESGQTIEAKVSWRTSKITPLVEDKSLA